jgi:tetratricopeptide (TPR) repeat protein
MSVLLPEMSDRKKTQTNDLIKVLEKELIKQLKLGNLELAKQLEIQIKELDEHYCLENLEKVTQTTIKKLFKQASQLKKKGNAQEAETKYQQILFWNHQNVEVWQELGLLYFQRFEYRKALDCAMNAIYLNPKSGKYHYHVGLILEKLKQIPQSIQAYYKALELDPTLVAAYHQVSNLISLIGELEKIKKIDR